MIGVKRVLLLALMVSISVPLAAPKPTAAQEDDEIAQILDGMSSAAKVGQLFLVTFPGSTVTDEAIVTELIREYHVGGVVLLPENDNIINEDDTPEQVATLIGQLQQTAWEATQPISPTGGTGASSSAPFIPLFIAVHHEGNGMPHTGIVNGTTPLPSEMALGATWDPSHARSVGQIAGQELRALGANMLLGPSLDVLETPRPGSAGDLGVRVFGGDPFWVGQMGKAYIDGVHAGANGRIAVVAKHFPGLGTSDRSLDEEIPTAQRTLEKLKQVDLAPFFAVTQAEEAEARPDGLLVSHIRFRGLEGGRIVPTRPISVDSQVLQRLLGSTELTAWREAGGVTISDGLGVRGLRRFYDPNEESFNGRRIAREAFLAGNDLLILSEFALTDNWEERATNIKSTITFFRERYDTDPSFQKLVDESLTRILKLKLKLYNGTFRLSTTQPDELLASERVGRQQEALSVIARDGLTLLSPPSPDLVPAPPTANQDIVIFVDARTGKPCASCAAIPYIDPLMLRDTIVRLYGPSATGQIRPQQVSSFTFGQLEEFLNVPPPLPSPTPGEEGVEGTPVISPIEFGLQNADWIIFAMLDPTGDLPQSDVVRRFLAERADALPNPRLVVLAYGAPYYLDATEISKLSAYYVAYSRTEPFLEASMRALFGEFAPSGTPPVSVPGINYELLTQTLPDPTQVIPVYTGEPVPEGEPTPAPVQLAVGDELRLRTGVVVDHNGHPVPDGTPIQFFFTYPQEGLEHSTIATTQNGVAEVVTTLDRAGQLDISIQADPAPRTVALQIMVQEGEVLTVEPVTPSPPPTVPLPTPTPTSQAGLTTQEPPPSTPEASSGEDVPPRRDHLEILDLVVAMISMLAIGGVGYYALRSNNQPVRLALRLGLWCIIGGLALYVVYTLLLPRVDWLQDRSSVWTTGWVALFGSLLPLTLWQAFGWGQQPK